MMRKNRIDTDLMYDYNPTAFLENAELIVKQLDNIEYLNLLISSLKIEDVSEHRFFDQWQSKAKSEEVQNKMKVKSLKIQKVAVQDKVNVVCDTMLAVFRRLDVNK